MENLRNCQRDRIDHCRVAPIVMYVVIIDGGEFPKFVLDILSFGPKHPVRDKFNEVQFFADVDKTLSELRANIT